MQAGTQTHGDGPNVHSYVATSTLRSTVTAHGVTRTTLRLTTYATMPSSKGLQGTPERPTWDQEMGNSSKLFCPCFIFTRHQQVIIAPGFHLDFWESCANNFALRSVEQVTL